MSSSWRQTSCSVHVWRQCSQLTLSEWWWCTILYSVLRALPYPHTLTVMVITFWLNITSNSDLKQIPRFIFISKDSTNIIATLSNMSDEQRIPQLTVKIKTTSRIAMNSDQYYSAWGKLDMWIAPPLTYSGLGGSELTLWYACNSWFPLPSFPMMWYSKFN